MSGSDETPFPVLLQQAAALKASRQAPLRKKFDSWPRWYQSSLFSAEDVVQARVAEFSQRMAFAMDCKQQGNNYFIANEFYEAMNAYERALAVFFWAEPTDPDWKKKDIDDDTIREGRYTCTSEEETKAVKSLELLCILNLASCYQKIEDWKDCIRACDHAISIEPKSTKAYYRRAQARYLPQSCGMEENMKALADLKKAHEISPDDQNILKAYESLRAEIKEQKQKDKSYSKKALRTDEAKKGPPAALTAPTAGSAPAKSSIAPTTPPVINSATTTSTHPSVAATSSSASSSSSSSSSSSAASSAASSASSTKSTRATTRAVDLDSAGTSSGGPSPSSSSSKRRHAKHGGTDAAEDKEAKASAMSIKEAHDRIKDIESAAGRLASAGRLADSELLFDKARSIRLEMETFLEENSMRKKINKLKQQEEWLGRMAASEFLNTSPEVVDEAKTRGLDLTDKRCQLLMAQMCKEMLESKHEQRVQLQKQLAVSVAQAYERKRLGASAHPALPAATTAAAADGHRSSSSSSSSIAGSSSLTMWEDAEEEREESLSEEFLARVMLKVRRREANDIARKIVGGLSNQTLRNMVNCRQVYKNEKAGSDTKPADAAAVASKATVTVGGSSTPAAAPVASVTPAAAPTAHPASVAATNGVNKQPAGQSDLVSVKKDQAPAAASSTTAGGAAASSPGGTGGTGGTGVDNKIAIPNPLPSLDEVDTFNTPMEVLTEVLIAVMIEDIVDLEHDPIPGAADAQLGSKMGGALAGTTTPAPLSQVAPGTPGVSLAASTSLAAADDSHGDKLYNMLIEKYGGGADSRSLESFSTLTSILGIMAALIFVFVRFFIEQQRLLEGQNSGGYGNYGGYDYSAGSGYAGAAMAGAGAGAALTGVFEANSTA